MTGSLVPTSQVTPEKSLKASLFLTRLGRVLVSVHLIEVLAAWYVCELCMCLRIVISRTRERDPGSEQCAHMASLTFHLLKDCERERTRVASGRLFQRTDRAVTSVPVCSPCCSLTLPAKVEAQQADCKQVCWHNLIMRSSRMCIPGPPGLLLMQPAKRGAHLWDDQMLAGGVRQVIIGAPAEVHVVLLGQTGRFTAALANGWTWSKCRQSIKNLFL